jgi:hypothetical protein
MTVLRAGSPARRPVHRMSLVADAPDDGPPDEGPRIGGWRGPRVISRGVPPSETRVDGARPVRFKAAALGYSTVACGLATTALRSGPRADQHDVCAGPFCAGPVCAGPFCAGQSAREFRPRVLSHRPAAAGGAGSISLIRTARNSRGVSRSTASLGSGTVRNRSTARSKYGRILSSCRIRPIAIRSPPSTTASSRPGYRSNTRAAVPAAADRASPACFSLRRAKRCCEVPPAALRPWTSREPVLDTIRRGGAPENTPAA